MRADRERLRTDVLVIGGGAAGSFAALAARSRGLEVKVVRKAWGATALSSGAADVAPDPRASPALPLGDRISVRAAAEALALARPDHPYAALRQRLPLLPEALAFASEQTGGLLRFADPEEENRLLLSPLGQLKLSAGGLDSIEAGDLLRAGGAVGVVGFDSLPLVDARLLAKAAAEAASRAGLSLRTFPLECDFFRKAGDALLRPHEAALRLEADPEGLIASIERALPAEKLSLLLLPPFVSQNDPGALIRLLQERLGIRCAELPGGSGSLPGVRLQRALEARLAHAKVEVIPGEVRAPGEGAAAADDPKGAFAAIPPPPPTGLAARIRLALDGGLGVDMGAPPIERDEARELVPIEAQAVILATGKFIGGGVQRRERLREPIFDLPIWVRGAVDRGRWLGYFTSHHLLDEQHALRAGVRIDPGMRPLLADGVPASERLFACGGVLAGNEPAQDGAGIGLAVFTGYLAGLAAWEHIVEAGGRG